MVEKFNLRRVGIGIAGVTLASSLALSEQPLNQEIKRPTLNQQLYIGTYEQLARDLATGADTNGSLDKNCKLVVVYRNKKT